MSNALRAANFLVPDRMDSCGCPPTLLGIYGSEGWGSRPSGPPDVPRHRSDPSQNVSHSACKFVDMEYTINQVTRWCPVCEHPGVAVVWGYPSDSSRRLAEQGQVILAGCHAEGMAPSHICRGCDGEFIAANRLYQRLHAGTEVYGVAVWPHGRRSVRIEANQPGWTVMIDGVGAMLLNDHDLPVFVDDMFHNMGPREVQGWASRRGFPAEIALDEDGWSLNVKDGAGFFELLLIKAWWRNLGRYPVEAAIERLSCHVSSPVWLPQLPRQGRTVIG